MYTDNIADTNRRDTNIILLTFGMSVSSDDFPVGSSRRLWGKIRYRHEGEWCTVTRTGEDELEAVFEKPVRAVTPGQAAVFYEGNYIFAGGTIF